MTGAWDRRMFLGRGVGTIATALASGPWVLADIPPAADGDPKFAPDTLFLTYSGDPTTSVTVQWVAREADVTTLPVRVRPHRAKDDAVTAPTTRKVYPFTDHPAIRGELADLFVYRAQVTGLKPGTEYEFRVGDDSGVSRFRTMPATLTNSFTFVTGGDCGVNPFVVANNRLAAAQDPMFAVVAGDLGYDNGRSVEVSLGFIRNYAQTMIDTQGRLIPLVVTIGNHEVNGGYNRPRKDAPFYFALFDGLYPETSYTTLDFGDYLSLVLLDTGHVSPIGGAQTDWLARQLAERAERPHLMVLNHVPAYPSFRAPEGGAITKVGTGEENRKYWVPLFEKHMVDIVLEHHDHTFKRTHALMGGLADPNGIIYLGDGSWGKLRVPKKAEDRPYLAATSASYHLTIHRLEAKERYHLAMEASGKVLDITRTAKRIRKARVTKR